MKIKVNLVKINKIGYSILNKNCLVAYRRLGSFRLVYEVFLSLGDLL